MKKVKPIARRFRSILLVLVLAISQVVSASGPFIHSQPVSAAPLCTVDTAGANDEPGQKDLTKLCVDYAGVPTTVATTWNWDETGTNGANTLDACNLFDTNGDGNINYSVCVTTQDDPAVFQSLTTYSCGDDKVDRCTSPVTVVPNGATTCSVSQQNTDPFPSGASYPKDTEGSCTVSLAAVGGTSAKLIDVCSYPSQEPNSDPSDCVIAQPKAGKLEVVKHLVPADDPGLFNLQIDQVTKATDVGNDGTTGEVVVGEGNHDVAELAGTGTSLGGYSSSISCRDLNGTGSVIASGNGTSLADVPIADGSDVVCIVTNTASSSITISKNAIPDSPQDFDFTTTGTGVSDFSLDNDNTPTLPSSKTFNGLAAGSYSFTETATTGWDFDNISCSEGASVVKDGAKVTITLSAGQNVSCTYVNRQRGKIIVHKVTQPANDQTDFQITASGSGDIAGNPDRTLNTSQDVVYDVAQGTYNVSEQDKAGWMESANTCSNLVINGNTPLVDGVPTLSCTITNVKLAKLKIVKDAQPNDPQDFTFTVTGDGLTPFLLDDDSDGTLPSSQQFTDLAPGDYSVTEGSVFGWALKNATCVNTTSGSLVDSTLSVTLAAGDDVTCTFVNELLKGSISGTKYEVNADQSVVTTLQGWIIQLWQNGQMVGQTTTDLNGNYSFTDILPGSYSLLEQLQSGWTQIFSPNDVNLTAGQDVTGQDFGNFENGSISGYKFNDLDGDGYKDAGEPKLSDWHIKLFYDNDDQDNLLNNLYDETTTDGNGNYQFTNLPPDSYVVCEVQQAGWVQTKPTSDGCYSVTIEMSGESNPNRNFGNQARGTITVIKNVDNDGDGKVDQQDVTDWVWDIDGQGGFSTGSSNDQTVVAGSHTVSEQQKTGYHVHSSSCTGEEAVQVSTEVQVNVSPGEHVVCTFNNARDTGKLRIVKQLIPSDDPGRFNLNINGTAYAEAVGDKGTTGFVHLVTGQYEVSETAGDNSTDLGDYNSYFRCFVGETLVASGQGTVISDLTVGSGQKVVCQFCNKRRPEITVIKDAQPNDPQDFHFTIDKSYDNENNNVPLFGSGLVAPDLPNYQDHTRSFYLDDDSDNTLPNTHTEQFAKAGNFVITEDAVEGWRLADIKCEGAETYREDNSVVVELKFGTHVTCTFTNQENAKIVVTKFNDLDRNGQYDPEKDTLGLSEPALPDWLINLDKDTQTTGQDGTTTFTDVLPNKGHELSETLKDGWHQSNIYCTNEREDVGEIVNEDSYTVYPQPGETVNCFIGNYHEVVLNLTKSNNRPNPTHTGDVVTYTLVASLPADSGVLNKAKVLDEPPEGFDYVSGSWTAMSSVRGDLKLSAVTPEPGYGSSPGLWQLGTMIPGEVVTLTYQTKIASSVTPGTYPDIAFAGGCALPAQDPCPSSEVVLSNLSVTTTPFVSTEVTVVEPEVLAAETTVLVNTGNGSVAAYSMMALALLLTGVGLALGKRTVKGGVK